MEFFKKKTNIDFIGLRKIAFTISVILTIVSVVLIIMKWNSNLSIDFVGGVLIQMKVEPMVPMEDIRATLSEASFKNVQIQQFHGTNEITIRMKKISVAEAVDEQVSDSAMLSAGRAAANTAAYASVSQSNTSGFGGIEGKILSVFKNKYPNNTFEVQRVEMVGAAVSKELGRKTFWAFFWGLIGIMIYVAWRFEFVYSVPAVVALFHDVPITIGFILLLNKEMTLTVMAAILTLIGYSINDTIVIYDRIREKVRFYPKDEIGKVMNIAINDTLSRTILTGGSVLMAVGAMFFLGGETLHDFAFVLLVGTIIGTYSSVFIASALVYEWERRHRGIKK